MMEKNLYWKFFIFSIIYVLYVSSFILNVWLHPEGLTTQRKHRFGLVCLFLFQC